MLSISSEQFEELIKSDPGWAGTLTRPVRVEGVVTINGEPITRLSEHLEFANYAQFQSCHRLKTAVGTFHCGVSFHFSSVRKIDPEKFRVLWDHEDELTDYTAVFRKTRIETATGKFLGGNADFSHIPTLTTIRNLMANAGSFRGCRNITRCPRHILENPNFIFDEDVRSRLLKEIDARERLKAKPVFL